LIHGSTPLLDQRVDPICDLLKRVCLAEVLTGKMTHRDAAVWGIDQIAQDLAKLTHVALWDDLGDTLPADHMGDRATVRDDPRGRAGDRLEVRDPEELLPVGVRERVGDEHVRRAEHRWDLTVWDRPAEGIIRIHAKIF